MNRTETVDFKNDDITTWDLPKIFEQIVSEYRLSLVQKGKLQKIQVSGKTDQSIYNYCFPVQSLPVCIPC